MVIFVLREMYFDKVIPWERRNRKCGEQTELVDKIEAEEKYFTEKMSLDDCQRFQKLVNLYTHWYNLDPAYLTPEGDARINAEIARLKGERNGVEITD